MSTGPRAIQHPLYLLLLEEDISGFNERRARGETVSLRGAQLRSLDLRGLIADGLDLGDSCLRNCDLRGIDFRGAEIEGATLTEARISGCYFPADIGAEEIRLSVEKGTRLRRLPR
jgi:uncharacterized protein YjbI with pentapeptide repeats